MKKIFCCTLLIVLAATTFCQKNMHRQPQTPELHLEKSKKLKEAGWWVLGSGALSLFIGATIPKNVIPTHTEYWAFIGAITFPAREEVTDGAATLMTLGAIGIITSGFTFYVAHRNRRKAADLSAMLKWESRPLLSQAGLQRYSFPAASFKIRL